MMNKLLNNDVKIVIRKILNYTGSIALLIIGIMSGMANVAAILAALMAENYLLLIISILMIPLVVLIIVTAIIWISYCCDNL